jgi:hypothetical protein
MVLNLKDAYLTRELHPAHQKYCRFRHPETGQLMQCPPHRHKAVASANRYTQTAWHSLHIYIDDVLLLHQDRLQLARSMTVILSLLQKQTGLNVKTSNCSFHPSQHFQCLGYVWNTLLMKTFVPTKRLKETHRTANRLLRLVFAQDYTTALSTSTSPIIKPTSTLKTQVLASFVGRAVASFHGILGA